MSIAVTVRFELALIHGRESAITAAARIAFCVEESTGNVKVEAFDRRGASLGHGIVAQRDFRELAQRLAP